MNEDSLEIYQLMEYRRGVDLFSQSEPEKEIVETCPWCGEVDYHFDIVGSWSCWSCQYVPGAESYGGQFS